MSSICLDSSAWIEITHDRPNAATFAEALASTAPVIVPTICLYEIAGYTTRVAGQAATEELLTFIQQHTIAPISADIATLAATLGAAHKLAMADIFSCHSKSCFGRRMLERVALTFCSVAIRQRQTFPLVAITVQSL